MIEPYAIQQLARTTIFAGPRDDPTYFSSESVIADVGLSRDAIELALNGDGDTLAARGFVVIVDFPIKAQVLERHAGMAQIVCTIPITVQIHSRNNAAGANKDAIKAIQKISSALLEYSGTEQGDTFFPDDDFFELMLADSGLLAFTTYWKKLSFISTTE